MNAGIRIKQARHRRGVSQRDLGEAVGVSATTISKYERGESKPDSSVLVQVAKALDLKPGFFLRPARVGEVRPAYRKLSRLSRKDERKVKEAIRDWLERYIELELIVHPEPAHFEIPPGFPRRVESMEEVEEAAEHLREVWQIGRDPIENLTELLEDHALRVGLIEAPEAFDACAFEAETDGGEHVIVTREDLPGDRQRFNLAHELGHLLLEVDDDLDEERVCHRFAGALLVPGDRFRQDLGERRRSVSLDELHILKHKYGASMQMLMRRALDLGMISESLYRRFCIEFSRQGWRQDEPGEAFPPERPSRFRLMALRAVEERLITRRRGEELWGKPLKELTMEKAAA